ncbi:MAG: DUF2306 domain-containing protein [Actinocatenispora sp.]
MSAVAQHRVGRGSAGRRRRRPWPIAVLAVATVATTLWVVSAYVPPDMATSRIPPRSTLHYVLLVAHIFTAAVAAVSGTVQFWPWLRRRFPRLHRWTGRTYFFLGVFPSAVLAIPVSIYAPLGASNQAGLLALDVLWIITGVAGYRAVRQRRYADHRRWMIRNFALIWASLASRAWIPLMLLAIAPQEHSTTYHGDQLAIMHDLASGSAWLGLFSTVVIVEAYIQRRYGVPARRSADARRIPARPPAPSTGQAQASSPQSPTSPAPSAQCPVSPAPAGRQTLLSPAPAAQCPVSPAPTGAAAPNPDSEGSTVTTSTTQRTGIVTHLLRPEEVPVDPGARALAARRLDRAHADGLLSDETAGQRRDRLRTATTRGDIRTVLAGVPRAVAPAGLVTALRAASWLTLAMTVVQFVVWLMICAISLEFDAPWWLYSSVPAAVVVAGLWLAVDSYHRAPSPAADAPADAARSGAA